jgi:RND family efflux transporter MFP subunit
MQAARKEFLHRAMGEVMTRLVGWLGYSWLLRLRATTSRGSLTCALLLALSSGCKTKESPYEPPPPPAVTAITTQTSDAPALVRKGTVAAGARFRLGFQVPGVIASVCCRTGDKVKQGQLLATLRAGDADARLRAANASRSIAERDDVTTSLLVDGGALAPNLAKHARDQLAIAEAQAALASEALRYTRLQSPVSGTIQMRFAEPGEAIAPGMPVLLVEQVGRLVVRVGVLQEELTVAAAGTMVGLELENALRNDAEPEQPRKGDGKQLSGIVASVAPVPETTDGLFTVEIDPKLEPGVNLIPGAIVSVYFSGAGVSAAASKHDARQPSAAPNARPARSPGAVNGSSVKVPNDALVTRNGVTGVLVLQESSTGSLAKFRPVTIGKRLGKDIWVSQGLAGGERIIAEGAYFIEDGERVRVLPKDAVPHG